MGVHSQSVTAAVDPAIVWEHWTDVEHWPRDYPTLTKAKLNGPLTKGAIGWIQPKGRRRKRTFRLVEVDRQKLRFGIDTKVLLGLITVTCSLERPVDTPDDHESLAEMDPDAWVLTHTLTVSGPLAKLWDRIAGRTYAKLLPAVLDRIVASAAV